MRHYSGWLAILVFAAGAVLTAGAPFPDAKLDAPLSATHGKETAVLAGGCFWGMQGLFERVRGVKKAVAGFAGGDKSTAHYEMVSTGRTGHAESIEITYDPAVITYGQILKIFFAVAHDPTEWNRQGPDTGTQYRSAIFYMNDEQKRIAQAYISQLDAAHVFPRPIVTQVVPYTGFYAAEAYHQHFLDKHPDNPYIVYNDLPKLEALKKELPQFCKRRD
jgi:peptide-methionine (S)-S-oxide reductase